MNLRQIEVFRAVMQAGSVTGGAAHLHVSAPAVSRLLSHLQTRLGVTLFQRQGGRLVPTPEAQALMREIDGAYRQIEQVRRTALGLRHGVGTRLRLATNLSTGLELVPRALARLQTTHPGVRVQVDVAPLARMREGLEAGEFDLAVGAFLDTEADGLSRSPIGSGELLVALPAGHRLAAQDRLSLAALRDEELVAYGNGLHGRRLAELMGWHHQVPRLEVPYAYMACALVASGAGVAVVDDLTLRHFQGAGLAVRPLSPRLQYRLDVLALGRQPLPDSGHAFVAALRHCWGTGLSPA